MIYDDYGTDMEAIETLRRDADIEQAEMERVGRAVDRAHRAGRCTHGGVVGYLAEPVYPEQKGLRPGQLACTDHTNGCNEIFNSNQEWYDAMDAAIGI